MQSSRTFPAGSLGVEMRERSLGLKFPRGSLGVEMRARLLDWADEYRLAKRRCRPAATPEPSVRAGPLFLCLCASVFAGVLGQAFVLGWAAVFALVPDQSLPGCQASAFSRVPCVRPPFLRVCQVSSLCFCACLRCRDLCFCACVFACVPGVGPLF